MTKKINAPYKASRAQTLRRDAGAGPPASLDEASRSVEVVASTEAPAMVMDWERWEVVPEVLLMSGLHMPPSGQVPLLDSHSRDSFARVLGSFRGGHIVAGEGGSSLVGRCHFSSVKEADEAFIRVKEGHVTDVSVGYEVRAYIWVKEGDSTTVEGRLFTGPLRVVTDWALAELSLCPIGADANAKVRHHQTPAAGRNKEKNTMPQKKKDAGGQAANPEKRSGLIGRLRQLLGLEARAEDDPVEDVELVDDNGNPIEPADLSDEELATVVEELDAALAEAEDEQASRDDDEPDEDEDGKKAAQRQTARRQAAKPASGGSAGRAIVLPSGRALASNQVAQIERARITAIRNLAQAHNLAPEIEDKLIASGVGLAAVKAQVLDMIQQRNANNPGPGFHVAVGTGDKEKFRAAAQDALSLRCGHKVDKPAAGADELRGYSLRELARELLGRSGQRPNGDIRNIVGRALATTDLPMLLVETSRRTLMEAFEAAPETWRGWAGTGIATDFKKSTAIGLEGDVKPVLKPEGGEYKEGRLAENAEEYKIATYGRKMIITREAIINDDLNALTALPRMYGEETAVLVGDVAYGALLANPNLMGDGKELFDADHRNLFAGKGGVPTVENLGAIVTGMKLQKDSFGKTITILPKFFLAPVALEVACEQFFNTQLGGAGVIGTQAAPLINNPYAGSYFTRVYDRRLDETSASAWYLTAARGTVVVFFLGGVESPYIEEQISFDTDGVESKVRMDVGAKAMRWATMAKAA